MPFHLHLFIDYDNLLGRHKQAGLLGVVAKALLAHPFATTEGLGHCDVRVYGGWYEGSNLTSLAQQLSAEIQADFPAVLQCPVQNGKVCKLSIHAELAYSLVEEPGHHLLDTFRQKQAPYNLRCKHPSAVGCQHSSCPLSMLPRFFHSRKCPEPTCSYSLADIISRSEQKLVDTMLTCDLIHAATRGNDYIIVISGDDDLLPAIRTASLRGIPVIRLHPKQGQQVASFPQSGARLIEKTL